MIYDEEITVLDLFSGIGGFSYALERLCPTGAFRTVAFCEREPFCQAVLKKHWPDTPIYDDVRTIPTDRLGRVDIIVGGFPCQPWSQAGQQRGAEDDRDLWPEMARLIEELQPKYLIGENVRGFVNQPMGLQRSLSDLESLGYQAVPFIIPACAVDAPHRRDRVWIVAAKNDTDTDSERSHRKNVNEQREDEPAHGQECVARQVRPVLAGSGDASERRSASVADAVGERQREERRTKSRRRISGSSSSMADAECGRPTARKSSSLCKTNSHNEKSNGAKRVVKSRAAGISEAVADASNARFSGSVDEPRETGDAGAGQPVQLDTQVRGEWSVEPGMGGMANGFSPWLDEPDTPRVASNVKNRVLRLRALGNAVVPQVVAQIGKAIVQAECGG